MKQLPHWVLTDTFPAFYDSESLTAVQQTARVYAAVQELIDEYNKFVDEINTHIDEYEHNKDAQMECFIEKITQTMNSYIESIDMKADSQNLKIAQAIEEMRLAYQTFEASMNDNQQGFEEEITERQTTFETDLTNKYEVLVTDLESLITAFAKSLEHTIENEGNSFIVGTDSQGVSYDYSGTVPGHGVDVTGQTLVNLWGRNAGELKLYSSNTTYEGGFVTITALSGVWVNTYSKRVEMFKPSTTYTVIYNIISNTLDGLFYTNVETNNVVLANNSTIATGTTGVIVSTFSSKEDISSCIYGIRSAPASTCTTGSITFQCIILEGDHTDKDISYFEGLKSVGETNGNQIIVTSKSEDETQVSTATIALSEPLRSLPNGVKDIAEWKNDKVVVTRNVGQVVLDGSEDEIITNGSWDNELIHSFNILTGKINVDSYSKQVISDTFKSKSLVEVTDTLQEEYITTGGSKEVFFTIDKSKLISADVTGIKTWLQSNPVTVAYPLMTPTTEEYDVTAPELYHHVFIKTGAIPTQETTHRVILNMSEQITSNTQTIASLEERVAQLETLAVTTLPLESEGDL